MTAIKREERIGRQRLIDYIVVHCSAGMSQAKEIRRIHIEKRGWSDIGYHAVIERDGSVVPGRPLERIPAQARGWNRHAVACCLVGGEKIVDFTHPQWNNLRVWVRDMKSLFQNAIVIGHRDFPGVSKACPRFDVRRWWYGDKYPVLPWED
jgi:hypothetical protein